MVLILDALDKIRISLKDDETQSLLDGLKDLSLECDKSESNRKFAASKDALNLLFSCCNHCYLLKNKNSLSASLDALCSFLHGQGDLADAKLIEFLANCLKELKEEILVERLVRSTRVACIKSESNRQTFVASDVIPCLVTTLREFRQSALIVKEACMTLRVFTFDDDMSVAFGKAHEHAKLIVAENAFAVILDIMGTCQDVEMASELCVTLSRLAVRNEYCKDIVDLGGLKMVLKLLQDHTTNQVSQQSSETIPEYYWHLSWSLYSEWRCGGLTVSTIVPRSSGLGSSPSWGDCVVFLRKTPRCINE